MLIILFDRSIKIIIVKIDWSLKSIIVNWSNIQMDKSSINVFEVKIAIKEVPCKISASDVFNEFLYLGDEKGK